MPSQRKDSAKTNKKVIRNLEVQKNDSIFAAET